MALSKSVQSTDEKTKQAKVHYITLFITKTFTIMNYKLVQAYMAATLFTVFYGVPNAGTSTVHVTAVSQRQRVHSDKSSESNASPVLDLDFWLRVRD